MMRNCPRCQNTAVIEDGYCGHCRECTLSPIQQSLNAVAEIDRVHLETNRAAKELEDVSIELDVRASMYVPGLQANKNNPYAGEIRNELLYAARKIREAREIILGAGTEHQSVAKSAEMRNAVAIASGPNSPAPSAWYCEHCGKGHPEDREGYSCDGFYFCDQSCNDQWSANR